MKERHYFASGNTVGGFKNHFDSLITKDGFAYILKGSSGSGKSTLMKSVGEYFGGKGYSIEYFHCSSDKDSLDGVRVVEKNICILDGTAPHVMEASLPQVNARLVNICDFISPTIREHQQTLETLLHEKGEKFAKFYAYLKCAGVLIDIEKMQSGHSSDEKLEQRSIELVKALKLGKSTYHTDHRSLYLKCIDKGGICEVDGNTHRVINLDWGNYFEASRLLEKVSRHLDEKNVEYVKILSPFGEDLIDGIFLIKKNVYLCNNMTERNKFRNSSLINTLLIKAGNTLVEARKIHKRVEKYFISKMDFDRLNRLKEEIINEIEYSH